MWLACQSRYLFNADIGPSQMVTSPPVTSCQPMFGRHFSHNPARSAFRETSSRRPSFGPSAASSSSRIPSVREPDQKSVLSSTTSASTSASIARSMPVTGKLFSPSYCLASPTITPRGIVSCTGMSPSKSTWRPGAQVSLYEDAGSLRWQISSHRYASHPPPPLLGQSLIISVRSFSLHIC
jgi:hypothetical protein